MKKSVKQTVADIEKSKLKKQIKIIKDFGWFDTKVSLQELLDLSNGLDPAKVFVEVIYDQPYDENADLILFTNELS